MSTRCHIAFYRNENDKEEAFEALLYRHSDGYPEGDSGVISSLLPFLKDFQKERGIEDIEYCAAWLMHKLIDERIKDGYEQYLGYGISNSIHSDIEYLYMVSPTKLKVKDVSSDSIIESYDL